MQCFWGLEAGVVALGILRYRHVRRTAHRDLIFELEEEEDWFAPREVRLETPETVDDIEDELERADDQRRLVDA
jgi:hypothetical protein